MFKKNYNTKMFSVAVLALGLLLAMPVVAQNGNVEGMPVVNADHSLTFNFTCMDAGSVKLESSFAKDQDMLLENGVWTLHTDTLPSEMYTYRFKKGKQLMLDPLNERVVRDIDDTLNYVIIDGYPGSYYMTQNVPHGTVEQYWYASSFDEKMPERRMSVYLPPDYNEDVSKRYPVLYLLHGTGGDELAWLDMGRMAQIMDNMIAEGKAKPMIVVMPNGIADQDAAPGYSKYTDSKASHSNMSSWMGKTENAFSREVMPFVESHFRTIADKEHRAIAGLSMGGLHTIAISANNPDKFGYVGLFSPQAITPLTNGNIRILSGIRTGLGKIKDKMSSGLVERSYDRMADKTSCIFVYKDLDAKLKAQFATPPRLYYIAIGSKDPLKPFLDKFRNRLSKQGGTYMYTETDGGHSWENWRRYLLDFLPRIF